ncbi:unnamed protein product, partial [Heterosigma akashiwo]
LGWARIKTHGNVPGGRSGHESVLVGSTLYVFGGCVGDSAGNGVATNQFYAFDLIRKDWRRIQGHGDAPARRASFCMVRSSNKENRLLVIGGAGGDSDTGNRVEQLKGDVHEYDIKTQCWRRLVCKEQCPSKFCWFYGQSISDAEDGVLLCFGGSTGIFYTNDVYVFNTKTLEGAPVPTSGSPPSARYKHSALVFRGGLWIFGGGAYRPSTKYMDVYRLDLLSLTWRAVQASPDQSVCGDRYPAGRVAHSCVLDPRSSHVYIWGGFDTLLNRLQDLWAFDMEAEAWLQVTQDPEGLEENDVWEVPIPQPRAFHSAFYYEDSMYLFGGAGGKARFADMWSYRFRAQPNSLVRLAAHGVVGVISDHGKKKERSKALPEELQEMVKEVQKEL